MKTEKYIPYAQRLARRFATSCGGDEDYVEDMEGVAMLALVEAAESFDEERGAAFQTYMHRCVMNALYDQRRKDAKHLDHERYDETDGGDDEEGEEQPSLPFEDNLSNPVLEAERGEVARFMMEALDELRPFHRRILRELYGLEGMPQKSTREVARGLGTTQLQVRRVRKAALDALRSEFPASRTHVL